MTTVKQKSKLLVVISLLFVFLFNFAASAAGDSRDEVLSTFSEELKQLVLQKENDGVNMIYESYEETQQAATRSINDTIIELPGNGYAANHNFTDSDQTWHLNRLFKPDSNCTMKIVMTTTIYGSTSDLRLRVYCEDTNQYVHNSMHYVSTGVGNPVSIPIIAGRTYTISVTSTEATKFGINVYAE